MSENAVKRAMASPDPSSLVGEGRDLDVTASIAWAGVLTTSQVERLHFPSRRRAQRRLRALLDHGLVRAHLQGEALQRENVYTATPLGIERLVEGGFFEGAVPLPARLPRPQHLAHVVAVREVFVALVLAERGGQFRVNALRFEGELRDEPVLAAAHLQPDALLAVTRQENELLVGVEVDRGTETTTTLRVKFEAWSRVLSAAGARLRFETALLLVTAPREARASTLRRLIAEAGLASRTRVVLLVDLAALLASGWPFPPIVPPVRTTTPRDEMTFTELPRIDDGFAPVRPPARG